MTKITIANEGEEFLVYFPEWTDIYQQMKARYQTLIPEIEANWERTKNISVQKDFALAIKDLPYQSILFALRSGKVKSVRASLQDEPVHKIIERILIQDSSIQAQIKAILDQENK